MPMQTVIKIRIKGNLAIDGKNLSAYGDVRDKLATAIAALSTELGVKPDVFALEAIPANIRTAG